MINRFFKYFHLFVDLKALLFAAAVDPMAGLGFGLPVSRLYAQYFGGNIEVRAYAAHCVSDILVECIGIPLVNTSLRLGSGVCLGFASVRHFLFVHLSSNWED